MTSNLSVVGGQWLKEPVDGFWLIVDGPEAGRRESHDSGCTMGDISPAGKRCHATAVQSASAQAQSWGVQISVPLESRGVANREISERRERTEMRGIQRANRTRKLLARTTLGMCAHALSRMTSRENVRLLFASCSLIFLFILFMKDRTGGLPNPESTDMIAFTKGQAQINQTGMQIFRWLRVAVSRSGIWATRLHLGGGFAESEFGAPGFGQRALTPCPARDETD
jgi:hypothetical protein